ncbi:MAG: ornithine cyclodeaminase family protein [Dehalococcoidia bacterium]|nr:ornithine cyclodeaminase family protein [Dehalococcoidia bacterium]
MPLPLYLSDDVVTSLITPEECAAVIEDLFLQESRGEAEQQPTVELHLPPRGVFRMKVGGVYGVNAFGFKAYLGTAGYRVFVYDIDEGFQGLVEAFKLTEMRTGAVSAVAAKHMARQDASTLGIIGTGREARAQLRALSQVRQLRKVKAYSRNTENRAAYAAEMSEALKLDVEPVASAKEAVQGAEILITMTNANDPVFEGADLEPGTLVCCVGATGPHRRELDDEAVARSGMVVVEHLPLAQSECAELIHANGSGRLHWGLVRELKDIVSGLITPRQAANDINLFTSIGTGAEDVAVASYVLRKAREQGVGVELPIPPPMQRRR